MRTPTLRLKVVTPQLGASLSDRGVVLRSSAPEWIPLCRNICHLLCVKGVEFLPLK